MSMDEPGLVPFAEGIWTDTDPVSIAGMPLTATMTVFRLGDGSLCDRPAQTLVVADRAHNVGRPEHPWAKFSTRAMAELANGVC